MRKMKDSGVEWIGEIPESWYVSKLKYLFADGDNGLKIGPFGSAIRGKTLEEGPYKIYNQAHLIQNDFNLNRHFVSEETYQQLESYRVKPGDVLFSMMGTIGKCRIMPKGYPEGIMDSHLLKAGFNQKILPEFFVYAYDKDYSEQVISQLLYASNGTIMNGLNSTILKSVVIAVPPIEEQRKIVNYLDEKCSKIDAIIARQEEIIEKLKEYKLSFITEAVTKGMDFDVEMKDSCIDWIGRIPKHWGIGKTLYALSMPITDGPHETPELYDEGVPFVSAEAVSCGNGTIAFDHIRGYISQEYYEECCKKYTPQINDIYMIKSGATTGKVAIIDTSKVFTIWSPLAVFRCDVDRMYFKYMYYFLQSDAYQKQVQDKWSFGTQQNIGMRMLEKLMVCFPPISEQILIANTIEEKCKKINVNIRNKEIIVEKLKQYKKSLIYEVVTGKKEV